MPTTGHYRGQMSDDAAAPEPDGHAEDPLISEEELMRYTMQYARKHEREQADATTDDDGNPYPRLDLDGAPPATDDPLLRVGYALFAELADEWEYALLMAHAAADDVRTQVMIRRPADDFATFQHLLYLPDVAGACAALRHSMYEPGGKGTWYAVTVKLKRNGVLVPHYDYEGPPFIPWGPGEVELLRRDQELYPRDPAQLPDWHPARNAQDQ